ncbi:MAG TPA: hypothetical protein VKA10_11780 [Prolixibacteraceae bacterium]|nr:hypothetical protein [Prolixibacteraceae bacterium]
MIILLLLSAVLSIAGELFKLQQYPYASALVTTSLVLWLISFVLILFESLQKSTNKEDF